MLPWVIVALDPKLRGEIPDNKVHQTENARQKIELKKKKVVAESFLEKKSIFLQITVGSNRTNNIN